MSLSLRITALLTAAALLFTAIPVCAAPLAPLSNPCALSGRFAALRANILKIADEAKDAANTAERLRRTSRGYPYKHIESSWADVSATAKPALDELSDFPVALSDAPYDQRNQAALTLTSVDRRSINNILDYTQSAVAFERSENVMSMQYRRAWGRNQLELTFSTPEMASRMRENLYARQNLNARFTEVDDALRTLKIAEYRYDRACNAGFISVTPTANPCAFSARMTAARREVVNLADEAREAGDVANKLHKTSLLRPYKRIERNWFEVRARADAELEKLSNSYLSLDAAPDGPRKDASSTLIVTYETALEHVIHYAGLALYYERAENESSYNDTPETLTFGVTKQNNKAVVERNGSLLIDGAHTEIGDVLRSLRQPEAAYAHSCGTPFSAMHIASVKNPCAASNRFTQAQEALIQLSAEARDAGNTALKIHHTSRWVPYKHVEKTWADIKKKSDSFLDSIADIPTMLTPAEDGDRKQAALNLLGAYQNAAEQMVDYTHYAVDYERAENSISNRIPPLNSSLNFGVEKSFTRMNSDNGSRNTFEGKKTEIGDALRALKIPEYNYDKLCNASIASRAPLPTQTAPAKPVENPCSLAERFRSIHAVIASMAQDAQAAADGASRIRNTSLWRPYKHVEKNWTNVDAHVEPMLETLSTAPIELDASPDGARKDAALDLTGAYEKAVRELADYTRLALYLERTENSVSMNYMTTGSSNFLNFGVTRQASKAASRNIARNQFEDRAFEKEDALLTLRLPERRYGALCRIAFSPLNVQLANEKRKSSSHDTAYRHANDHRILLVRRSGGGDAL